ncbi:MAG: DUF4886 domain-containing protein [Lysobacterales bacterium]
MSGKFQHQKIIMRFVAALGLALCLGACTAANLPKAQTPDLKVLFVGNSFTYYNNSLHNHVRRLVRSANDGKAGGKMRALTLSGARLEEHLPGFEGRLVGTEWDWVVLQGHSREAYDGDVSGFMSTVDRMANTVNAQGAKTALFMTWAYTGEPEMTGVISTNYRLAGSRSGAPVVPVGLAFDRAGKQAPEISLRTSDRLHPTLAGTYLAACVFYSWFYTQSSVGLEYAAGLDPTVAATLQKIASDTVNAFAALPAQN